MNKRILAAALALTMSACICGCSESEKTTADRSVSPKETVSGEKGNDIDDVVTDDETTDTETTAEESAVTDEETVADPNAEHEDGIHILKCSQRFAALDDKNGFYFEVELSPTEADSGINVALYDDKGEKVADMLDDGSGKPDKTAGDNIYSCFFKPKSKKAATYDLTAKIGAIETDTVRVRLYDELDNDDFDKLRKVTDDFMKIDAKYRDNTGIIPDDKKEAALKEASALAQKMFDNGEVIELSIDQNHGIITIWLDSYLPYIYNIDTLE
ncbi:MAG: hypothetical protein E7494_15550 [Ruminococcus albus]|jgi:hypothetical protein|nr:hypothetical protein [Ruminococcus albus]